MSCFISCKNKNYISIKYFWHKHHILRYYIKLKFLEPFAMISLISALMSIHKLKLMSKSLQKSLKSETVWKHPRFIPNSSLSEICCKYDEITVSFDKVFRHLFPERLKKQPKSSHKFWYSFCVANLLEFWLKVELLLCPDNALSQVLEAGAALLGRPTEVDDVVHVRLALHGLGDVLVQLLNHLEVTEPVLLLEELFLVWELILISLKSMTGKNLKTQEPRHRYRDVSSHADPVLGWLERFKYT